MRPGRGHPFDGELGVGVVADSGRGLRWRLSSPWLRAGAVSKARGSADGLSLVAVIVLDSTVLIDYFRGCPAAQRVDALIDARQVLATTSINVEEIARGLKPGEDGEPALSSRGC